MCIRDSVWALWLTGTTVNAVAMIGMILLAGIVVNNAIVLVLSLIHISEPTRPY